MTVSAELLVRARRHELVRDTQAERWLTQGGRSLGMVWLLRDGWSWAPPDPSKSWHLPTYPTEEGALRAALDWLDTKYPERAYKPAPWAPVVSALALVRPVLRELSPGAAEAPERLDSQACRVHLDEAVQVLERALGARPAATFEEALLVLLDLRLQEGKLGKELLERLRLALQARPDEAVELVDSLQIAGEWLGDVRYALQHCAETGQTEQAGYVWVDDDGDWQAEVLGQALERDAGPGEVTGLPVSFLFPTRQHAMAAVDAALLEESWALAGGAVQVCDRCDGFETISESTSYFDPGAVYEGPCPECNDGIDPWDPPDDDFDDVRAP